VDRPTLSICIPTYNRAEMLRMSLNSLAPQVGRVGHRVEIVVSDNCSSDDTPEVVAWARQYAPVRYHRNEVNVGAAGNVLALPRDLAAGEFCWLLGDDDLVREGGVERVLGVLERHPHVDYVFVALCHIEAEALRRLTPPVSSRDLPADLPGDNDLRDDRYLARWEELIDPQVSPVFLGGMQASVFRRSVWLEHCVGMSVREGYDDLDSTYPHAKIFSCGLVGRPAYYIGEPQVVVVDGVREWLALLPKVYLLRLNELLDHYGRAGVPQSQIGRCRSALLASSGHFILRALLFPGRARIPRRRVLRLLWEYRGYGTMWRSLARTLVLNRLVRRVLYGG